MGIEYAWILRELMGYGDSALVEIIIRDKLRIPGMAFYAITLSYQLLVTLSLYVITINYYRIGVNHYIKLYDFYDKKIFVAVIISIGILLSGSRSAYPALFLLFFVATGHINFKQIILFVGLLLFVIFINDDLYARLSSMGLGDGGRVQANMLALYMIYEHPFGIGSTPYSNVVLELFNIYDFEGYSLEHMQNMAPHNHILYAAINFGIVPIIVYLLYNVSLVLRVLSLHAKYKHIIIIAIVVYHVHTMFHNAGMLFNEQMGWYLFGIIEGVLALNSKNTPYNYKNILYAKKSN